VEELPTAVSKSYPSSFPTIGPATSSKFILLFFTPYKLSRNGRALYCIQYNTTYSTSFLYFISVKRSHGGRIPRCSSVNNTTQPTSLPASEQNGLSTVIQSPYF
jgi:hypothetical protein